MKEQNCDINVVFDTKNMEDSDDAGTASSLTIEEKLTGITFRNALRIVLRRYSLDFCILNDCLYITTQDEIKNN
ncbi:MAG: hypothetical protein IKW74_02320, partial [Thermoguttaceae bacterium]|nr:hypothetical protein [Thermoguttaceae bacterium]